MSKLVNHEPTVRMYELNYKVGVKFEEGVK